MSNLALLGGKPEGKLYVPMWPMCDESEIEAVSKVLQSGVWGMRGPNENAFEKAFAEFCGTKYAVALTNGTHTLRLSLEALEIGPGDEVLVPGSTWQATAAAVLDVNAVPVLVDVDPDNYCIDVASAEKAINDKTRCIIPVHLYGRVCDMDAVMALASKYNLRVIEDCSHQHGSEWKGKKVGSIGDIGSFSLQGSKVLTSGEGGVVTTDDERLYLLLQSLKSCGRAEFEGAPSMQSGNHRISEMAAAILLCQMKRLEGQLIARDENAHYVEGLMKDIPGITLFKRDPRVTRQSYYTFSFKYEKDQWEGVHRNVFIKALGAELENSVFLTTPYEPLNNSPIYRPLSKKTHKLNAEYCRLINPARFSIPVCDDMYYEKYVGILHWFLLSEKTEYHKFVNAINKIRDNIGELVNYQA